ncbi:peroxisomal membrane protein [Teratosphaeria destructans]|uniref:Peroxisomal membrane protein n=1 Tax=Teratosphaeria destructans TaxID=418781 RepID=A0A9W7W8J7_9PEZI|nr:peroxisomal membrane protein [Teratosphaeria destructans]
MPPLQVGDKFPDGVQFEYAPPLISPPARSHTAVLTTSSTFDASKEFKGKKVVIVSVPGAFTPGCQANHIPPILANLETFIQKGVDLVAVIGFNDAWVMSAWGKVNGVKGDSKILFLSDTKSFFSKNHGWDAGMGERNGRWAMIVDKDGTVTAATFISKTMLTFPRVSGADAILSKL